MARFSVSGTAPDLEGLEAIDAEVRALGPSGGHPRRARSLMDFLVNIVILLAIIVPLVLAHELGHFVMARRAGVTVHEFGIGFPPRALILHRGKETIYSLNWLPIGGFVRLEAEEGESLDPRAFVNQKLGTRLRILIAGVVVNFAIAWLIFTLIALFAEPVWQRPRQRGRARLARRSAPGSWPAESSGSASSCRSWTPAASRPARRAGGPSTTTRATSSWPSTAAASRSSTTSPRASSDGRSGPLRTSPRAPGRPSS